MGEALSTEQFASLPEYRSIKEIIDGKLSGEGIEHAFFEGKGKEHLLFKVEDAPSVSRTFGDLEKQADIALDRALEERGKTREQIRDAQPLGGARGVRPREREGDGGGARQGP